MHGAMQLDATVFIRAFPSASAACLIVIDQYSSSVTPYPKLWSSRVGRCRNIWLLVVKSCRPAALARSSAPASADFVRHRQYATYAQFGSPDAILDLLREAHDPSRLQISSNSNFEPHMRLPFNNSTEPIIAHRGLSDATEALFTSTLWGWCCQYGCRRIMTSGNGKCDILRQPLCAWNVMEYGYGQSYLSDWYTGLLAHIYGG